MIIVYHHTSLPYHKWCNEWTTKTMRRGGQRRTTRAREEPIIGTSLPWCWVIILLVEVPKLVVKTQLLRFHPKVYLCFQRGSQTLPAFPLGPYVFKNTWAGHYNRGDPP